ncbi:MAG: helix-turn-helix domain-containing protein [Agathobaculum sp.]|jgi:transcriptional regulator with XRE-family HTH domain|uniref:helix-turn-helix domain-containing protein n=1 Tax=Agathobaculum sp. TaxID=2048138 RepID=UPI003D8B48D9
MTLGEKIIDLRKKRGLSQEDLAITLGVSRQAVSKWETDEATPDTAKIVALAEYFHVTTDWLLRNIAPEPEAPKKAPHTASAQAHIGTPLLLCMTIAGCVCGLLLICYGFFRSATTLPTVLGLILLVFSVALATGYGLFLRSAAETEGTAFIGSFWRIAVWFVSPVVCYPLALLFYGLLTEIPYQLVDQLWLALPRPAWNIVRFLLLSGVPLLLYLAVCLFVSLRLCRRSRKHL